MGFLETFREMAKGVAAATGLVTLLSGAAFSAPREERADVAQFAPAPIVATLEAPVPSLESAVAATSTARRRPVRRPVTSVPQPNGFPTSLLPVVVGDRVYLTNHGDVAATATLCEATCTPMNLAAGQTSTFTATGTNGLIAGWTTTPTEIRTAETLASPGNLASTFPQHLPVMDLEHTLTIYALHAGNADIRRTQTNGIDVEFSSVALNPGVNTINPGFTPALGEYLKITTDTPSMTFNGTTRAKFQPEATGVQYVPKGDNDTLVFVVNPDPSGLLNFNSVYFAPNQPNQVPTYIKSHTALNGGSTTASKLTNGGTGMIQLLGMFISGEGHMPFNAWSFDGMEYAGATANAGFGENGKQKFNVSHNNPPNPLTIVNGALIEGPVTGTVTGYDAAGNETGSIEYNLPMNTSIDLDLRSLNAARITLSTNDAANSTSTTPNTLISGGYRIERPAPKVTGEEYANKWLTPLLNNYFFFNPAEARDMLNSSFGEELLALTYKTSTFTGPFEEYVALFRTLDDGNLANGEMLINSDPQTIDLRVNRAINCYDLEPNANRSCHSILNEDIPTAQDVSHRFVAWRSSTKPAEYGGSTRTGPNLDFDPTYTTQDFN